MGMPEAAMNENSHPPSPKNKVGSSRQNSIMKPVTKPLGMQVGPHGPLGLRVLPFDFGHQEAARLGGNTVHGFGTVGFPRFLGRLVSN